MDSLSIDEKHSISVIFQGELALDKEKIEADAEGTNLKTTLESYMDLVNRSLETKPTMVFDYLISKGIDWYQLRDALMYPWLYTEVTDSDLQHKTAEALGSWSIAVKEDMDAVIHRIKSNNKFDKLWALTALKKLSA